MNAALNIAAAMIYGTHANDFRLSIPGLVTPTAAGTAMEFDERAAEAKRESMREAAAAARRSVNGLSDRSISEVLDAFSRVTPPEEPDVTIGLITIASVHNSPNANSRKPGNVVLNWRKLIDIVPDVSLAGLG